MGGNPGKNANGKNANGKNAKEKMPTEEMPMGHKMLFYLFWGPYLE
jgi:hypothetical protein